MKPRVQPNRWTRQAVTIVGVVIAIAVAAQAVEIRRSADRSIGVEIEQRDGSGLWVTRLASGSVAERAGLRVGDRLLEVDGRSVLDLEQYDLALSGSSRGSSLPFQVDRHGAVVQIEIAPGMPVDWWRFIRRVSVSLLCLVVGVVSLAGGPNDRRTRLLAVLFFTIAFEFSLPEALRADSLWELPEALSFYLITGVQLAVEWHLAAVVVKRRLSSRGRAFVTAGYLLGAAVATIGSLTYAVERGGGDWLPWTLFGLEEIIHQAVFPVWAVGLVCALAISASRAVGRQRRAQAALVLLGVLPWAVYIGLGWALDFPERTWPHGWWAILGPLLVLCYPVTVFVAISRYHLFDLEVVVRRGLVYTALTTTLLLSFYAALGAGGAIFSHFLEGGVSSIWTVAAATLLLGLLFAPLRRAIQRSIDHLFFPEREAMRRRLIALASELPAMGKLERMGRHLVQSLRRIFRIRSAALLLVEPSSGALEVLARSGDALQGGDRPVLVALDDPAVVRLHREGRPVSIAELRSTSPQLDQKLRLSPDGLGLPLCLESRLVGVLLLSEKASGLRFSAEENELLGLLGHQVAAVLENVRLFESATYERLTGLLRREGILELLDAELARAVRYRRPLTVALADIDHFKGINDRFGHLEGDRVLRRVARELRDELRSSDGIGRYGGEEFLLVFPETDLTAAGQLSEKLRLAVEHVELRSDEGEPIAVRVSIGLASLSNLHELLPCSSALLNAADRELYRAKRAGRNRVEPRCDLDAARG